jgi:hypothetical protein
MKIDILKTSTVGKIKHDFSDVYPFLKIEFFKRKQGKIAGDAETLSAIQPMMREGSIKIHETMKVKDLEHLFESDFLLIVQVYRRSGNVWLETNITDNWTLAQQNEHAREITESCNPAEASENDYELMRDQD